MRVGLRRGGAQAAARRGSAVPLPAPQGALGVIGLKLPPHLQRLDERQQQLARTMVDDVAQALLRTRLVADLQSERVANETERLFATNVFGVLNVIRALAEEGRTMLLVTHEMSFARQVSSEVVFLHQGLVEEQGSPEQVFINPVLEVSGPVEPHSEGCLSLPDIFGEVQRPPRARITATDLEGNRFTLESDAFEARVWQHEFDHLEGVLIIDRMMPRCRLRNRRAIRDLERAGG